MAEVEADREGDTVGVGEEAVGKNPTMIPPAPTLLEHANSTSLAPLSRATDAPQGRGPHTKHREVLPMKRSALFMYTLHQSSAPNRMVMLPPEATGENTVVLYRE